MTGTCLQPTGRIFTINPATDLKTPRIGRQRLAGRGIVTRSELNHVTTSQRIFAIKVGIITCGPIALEVRLQACAVVTERTADNLLHFTCMEVNTWAELCHFARKAQKGNTEKRKVTPSTLLDSAKDKTGSERTTKNAHKRRPKRHNSLQCQYPKTDLPKWEDLKGKPKSAKKLEVIGK